MAGSRAACREWFPNLRGTAVERSPEVTSPQPSWRAPPVMWGVGGCGGGGCRVVVSVTAARALIACHAPALLAPPQVPLLPNPGPVKRG